jgi:predicted ATPase with chaperone activity
MSVERLAFRHTHTTRKESTMNIRPHRKTMPATLAAVCASAALYLSVPALAQQEPPAPQAPAAAQASAQVSDTQIEAFAKAQERVVEIGNKWNTQLQQQGEASPEAINSARESAHKEMVIAVEALGMSVDEYNRIAIAMQNDPDLQQRVREARSGS